MKKSASYLVISMVLIIFVATNAVAEQKRYKRTEETYVVPDVVLINQDREKIHLVELLNSDKPVLVDFIYGTCTTICPILSAGYSNLQRKLAPDPEQVRLISISIDPEYDTPEVMTEYLARYQAKPGWDYLTGSREDIEKVMHAFDAYVQDKMSHFPLTLIRTPGGNKWIRIYGLVGTSELMKEYAALYKK
jgi:protein SCO1/2